MKKAIKLILYCAATVDLEITPNPVTEGNPLEVKFTVTNPDGVTITDIVVTGPDGTTYTFPGSTVMDTINIPSADFDDHHGVWTVVITYPSVSTGDPLTDSDSENLVVNRKRMSMSIVTSSTHFYQSFHLSN